MRRALRAALIASTVVLASLWTLAAVGAWWLLQAGASAMDAQPAAVTLQAVDAWTERPWVRHWLDPDQAAALRDGVAWLLDLGGGPAAWLASAVALATVALILVWAGGLLLAAVGVLASWLAIRWVIGRWHSGSIQGVS